MQFSTNKPPAVSTSKRFELDASPGSPMKGRTAGLSFCQFQPRYCQKLGDSEIMQLKLNINTSLGAVAYSDGSLQIISTMLGDKLYEIKDEQMYFPITCVAWKPTRSESQEHQKLLGTTLNGEILRWTPMHGNSVDHLRLDESHRYHAIDYASDGRKFCIGGAQPTIEIWDEDRLVKVQSFGDKVAPAHTNKVFTCRFSQQNQNMMYSGGWDSQIKFWDIRASQVVHRIGGVQICGESVDISSDGNYVVTGGGSKGEGIKIWDFRDLKAPLRTINWHQDGGKSPNPLINCARFVPGQNLVLVGANDDTAAKSFNIATGAVVEEFKQIRGTCFSLDVSDDASVCCFGDGDGQIHFKNLTYQQN